MGHRPSNYFGEVPTRTVGRTRLLVPGGVPVASTDTAEPQGKARETSHPSPPAPATRQLRARQAPAAKRADGAEWGADRVHDGCDGQVGGFAQARPACQGCGAEWWRDRAGRWVKFGR